MGQKHDAMKAEIGMWGTARMIVETGRKGRRGEEHFLTLSYLAMARLKSKKLSAVLKKHILRRDKSIIADQVTFDFFPSLSPFSILILNIFLQTVARQERQCCVL